MPEFSHFPANVMNGSMSDLDDNVGTHIYCCLMTNLATINQDTWDSYANVVADGNECVGAGYVAGGAEVTTKTVTPVLHVTTFDGDNITFGGVSITARYAVLFDDTPGPDADKKLLGYWDFGADYGVVNGNFTLSWNAAGILTITVT